MIKNEIMNLKMFINDEWVESESHSILEVINPSTKQKIAVVPKATSKDVELAVESALKAFNGSEWQNLLPVDRARLMHKISNSILEHKEELAELETLDTGKPLSQANNDVVVAARYFEYYAGVADKILGETIPIKNDILDFTLREPLGVTAHIVPWNYPLQMTCRSLAAAIATGNTAVIKPAEDTPLTTLKLAEICKGVGLPKGVINVVTGLGHEAGAELSKHPDISHITFTGSVKSGIEVMKSAAENIVPVTLELGGKSPNIVFHDADLEDASNWVIKSITQNAGQTCSAGSRLLVESSIHKEFLQIIKNKMEKLKVGQGIDDLDMGPIISELQLNRIISFMEVARNESADIIIGGEPVENSNLNGYFFKPTIIDNVQKGSRIAVEEIFGPVLAVIQFSSLEEALEIANETSYGLVTGIWTTDINKAHWLANKVKSGQVFVNNYGAAGGVEMPFGGYKKSGFGREKGLEALKYYTQLKNVAIKFNN